MPAGDEVVLLRPLRRFPLPVVITDLNNPWSGIDESRHVRVNQFQEGYNNDGVEDPRIVKPAISKSDLLTKM